MTDNKGLIRPSQLLAHPLIGRAGLLREIGAFQDHGAVFASWAKGLEGRQIWADFPTSPNSTNYTAFTTFVHDEASHSIIAGLEKYENHRFRSMVSAHPAFVCVFTSPIDPLLAWRFGETQNFLSGCRPERGLW